MLRGYRLFILAVGLALAGPGYGQEASGDQQKTRNQIDTQLERIAAAIEKQPVASAPDSGCEPGQENRQSDLCAQWKAADAAAESARWAFWTFFATIAGLAIGGGTLLAAWRAAHWAKKAADHTQTGTIEAKRAADAAEKSVAETRRIGEAQVRCYLSAEKARIVQLQDGKIIAYCTIRNTGSSPAIDVRMDGDLSIYDVTANKGAILRAVHHEKAYPAYGISPAVEKELGPLTLELVEEDKRPHLHQPKTLVTLRITARFEDVFGVAHEISGRFDFMPQYGFLAAGSFELERGSDIKIKDCEPKAG